MIRLLYLSPTRKFAGFLFEGGLIFVVLYALALVTASRVPADTPVDPTLTVLLASFVFAGSLFATRHGSMRGTLSFRREFVVVSIFLALVGVVSFIACCFVYTVRDLPSLLMIEGAIAVPAVVVSWRWTAAHVRLFQAYRERILIVGTGEAARNVCRWIARSHADEFNVVGFAGAGSDRIGEVLAMGARIQTRFDDLVPFCRGRVDRVIVALDEKRGVLPIEPLMKLRMSGLEIEDATSFVERTSGKIAVETLLPSWLIFSDGFKISPIKMFCKRLSDFALSFMMLVPAIPVMIVTAIAIRLEGRGPILYRQLRLGCQGRPFEVLKFRSMRPDAEKISGPAWASENDPRITRVGRVIRKLRIDELPQLLNILRGEMSFVGPRPERPHFADKLRDEIRFFDLRLAVRPGLTGWAQVEYSYGSTVEENREKLKYDLYYIKNLNLLLDIWIVVKTIRVVLQGSGAR